MNITEKIKDEHKAACLFLFAILSQWAHKRFEGIKHSSYIRIDDGEKIDVFWSDIIYWFFNKTAIFILAIVACSIFWTNEASRTIMAGVFGWYAFEWVEIILKMTKVIEISEKANSADIWQLLTAWALIMFVFFFGRKK